MLNRKIIRELEAWKADGSRKALLFDTRKSETILRFIETIAL